MDHTLQHITCLDQWSNTSEVTNYQYHWSTILVFSVVWKGHSWQLLQHTATYKIINWLFNHFCLSSCCQNLPCGDSRDVFSLFHGILVYVITFCMKSSKNQAIMDSTYNGQHIHTQCWQHIFYPKVTKCINSFEYNILEDATQCTCSQKCEFDEQV